MKRSVKDGGHNGLKQDRYRHSRFEENVSPDQKQYQYQSQSQTSNTIGGAWAENRGHRTADDRMTREHYDNPFENEGLSNWNHKKGWDDFYNQRSVRSGRRGGAILEADEENHRGRGPKGYSRSDESILEDVNESLLLSRDVDAREVDVKVKAGIVYLNGTIESRQMKRMAELEIENISGVKDVQNMLTIKRAS